MAPLTAASIRGAALDSTPRQGPAEGPASRPEDCRRPLYLCTRLKARVDADGPALRVRSAGRAEARYPLYRVSRVIASNRVDWSAAALEACLQSGIPIVIVAGSGTLLGSVQPARVSASRLFEDIDELLDRPDWREIYDNWLRATRMRVLGEWRMSREAAGDSIAPGEFGEMVRRFVYGCVDATPFEEATGLWRGALPALAATELRRAGLQSVYWGAGGTELNLLDDVSHVLELRLRLEVRGAMGQALHGEALALRVFHSKSAALEAQCGRILRSLARRVKQVLAEWR
jgi:hypothetical protein